MAALNGEEAAREVERRREGLGFKGPSLDLTIVEVLRDLKMPCDEIAVRGVRKALNVGVFARIAVERIDRRHTALTAGRPGEN